uniref:Gag-pol polyprotein n=1 Tax=Solanum tuberosum TaxID=4113 RepID=M1DIX7_SOLTU
MKGVARIWFDQWKWNRAEGAPLVSWALFEEAFLGGYIPRELREAKVEEEKLKHREEFRNKIAKTWNAFGQQKSNANRSSFQPKQRGPASSSASALVPRNRDPGASLSFVTPYVVMNFDVLREELSEFFSVSTPIGKSILAKRVYRDCTISENYKSTMVDLIELDMVDFDVLLCMD